MTDTTIEGGAPAAPAAGAPVDEFAFLNGAEFSDPEPAKSTTTEQESKEPEAKEPDDKPDPTKPASGESVVFQYGDEEIALDQTDPPPAETESERQQRERAEALEKELNELKAQKQPPQTELKEPGFYDAGIDGDPEKFAAAMREYSSAKAEQELEQKAESKRIQDIQAADNQVYQQNLNTYNQRLTSARAQFPDIERADNELARLLTPQHASAIIAAGLENPEMVVYALHKRPELREAFSKENNPIRLGVMLADISKKSRIASKATQQPVNKEPEISGSQGASPTDKFFKEFPDAEIS
ncbi:TPA: hypothetical protein ACNIQM_002100 [Citrobacter werkmanii]